MKYGITIEYKYPCQKLMKGIYRITFGDMFYIGQCKRLAQRMYQHERGIYGCFRRYAMPRRYETQYLKLAKYLHEHPKLRFGTVEMIQRCVTDWDLVYAERNWLADSKGHPDCLNSVFDCNTRYVNDDIWDISMDGKLMWYSDPRDPTKRVHHLSKLTQHGHPWKQKLPKKMMDDILKLQSDLRSQDTTL